MQYSVDGDFGKVRMISHLPTANAKRVFNYTTSAGWHKCNDRYHISREKGFADYIVFFTIRGCGHMRVNGRLYSLDAGTAGIIPRGAGHEYFTPKAGDWEFYWMHINGVSAPVMLDYITEISGFVIPVGEHTAEISSGMEDIIFLKRTNQHDFECQCSQIVTHILHCLASAVRTGDAGNTKQRKIIRAAIEYIETHYRLPLTIQALSRALYINSAYLTRLFKSQTGYTPYAYLKRYRIMAAKDLLFYTDLSIKEIADQTGFAQASNFIAQFRAAEHVTPAAYRKNRII